MKIVLFFAMTGLAGYVFGYFIGRWTTEQKLESLRAEMQIEEGDELDELFK